MIRVVKYLSSVYSQARSTHDSYVGPTSLVEIISAQLSTPVSLASLTSLLLALSDLLRICRPPHPMESHLHLHLPVPSPFFPSSDNPLKPQPKQPRPPQATQISPHPNPATGGRYPGAGLNTTGTLESLLFSPGGNSLVVVSDASSLPSASRFPSSFASVAPTAVVEVVIWFCVLWARRCASFLDVRT
jgi:hypothetical protein